MGNLIVIIVVAFILFLAIRPIIKHNKNKGSSDYGCYKCSGSSSCKGCNKQFINKRQIYINKIIKNITGKFNFQ